MQVKLGATVVSSDGQNIGAVDRLVIDPVSRQLLSMVVRQGRWLTEERIIGRQFVDDIGVNGSVRITLPADKVDTLPQFAKAQFITPQANWDSVLYPRVGSGNMAGLGISSSFAATSSVVKASGPGGGSISDLPGDLIGAGGYGQVNFEQISNLPSDALLIDSGTDVLDRDEKKVGEIDDFTYNAAGEITGFRVRGGLFGRRRMAIPVSAVAGASLKRVRLNIPLAEIEHVAPPVETPSRLVVLSFETPAAAEEMLEHVRSMEARGLLLLDDAVVVTVAENDTVTLTQTRTDTGRFALRGAGAGVLAGLLLGGPIVGLAAGAAIGAITGKVKDAGLSDEFIRDLSRHLEPGHAALFLLVHRADFARILEDLRPFSAEVLHADLSPHRIEALRDALTDEVSS